MLLICHVQCMTILHDKLGQSDKFNDELYPSLSRLKLVVHDILLLCSATKTMIAMITVKDYRRLWVRICLKSTICAWNSLWRLGQTRFVGTLLVELSMTLDLKSCLLFSASLTLSESAQSTTHDALPDLRKTKPSTVWYIYEQCQKTC